MNCWLLMDTERPPRPTREALAAVLTAAAAGAPLVADRPVAEVRWGVQRVDMASGWQLAIWWHADGSMGPLHGAVAPDGGEWTFGCDRWPDWLAGPDAVVLDPIEHLLDGEQRERLRARLLACSCWPAPVDQVYWYSARWIG